MFSKTPDRFFGPRFEEALCLEDQYGVKEIPDWDGAVVYVADGYYQMKDKVGTFNPRDDERIKITQADNYGGYLSDKLIDGYNISLEVLNDGNGNEQIKISSTGSLPPPICFGQILFAADGTLFQPELPLTGCAGWLVNDNGILLVTG